MTKPCQVFWKRNGIWDLRAPAFFGVIISDLVYVFLNLIKNLIFLCPLKTYGFLMFSGGIKRDQWHEMGWKRIFLVDLPVSLLGILDMYWPWTFQKNMNQQTVSRRAPNSYFECFLFNHLLVKMIEKG